jgi:hypothetical protein
MSKIYRQRKAFEKDVLSELSPRLKNSKWKKSSCALFTRTEDFYQDVFISVHRNAALTTANLRFKPMALDPILWDILDIPENRSKPLSFRTWGAFTCSGLPIYDAQLEKPDDTAGAVADSLIGLCNSKSTLFQELLATDSFSNLVAAHPNQTERGAYAVTLVTSHINDGNLELAHRTASAYASGTAASYSNLTSFGKSFHQLALEWIDAGKDSNTALHAAVRA